MPKVGNKHYPYTEEGYKAAAKARKKKKKKKKRVRKAHGGMVRGPCSYCQATPTKIREQSESIRLKLEFRPSRKRNDLIPLLVDHILVSRLGQKGCKFLV